MVVSHLPSDLDVTNFAKTSHRFKNLITPIIWQQRYLKVFDNVPGASPEKLSETYASRQGAAKVFTTFDSAVVRNMEEPDATFIRDKQQTILGLLKNLIIESDAKLIEDNNGNKVIVGNNLTRIRQLVSHVVPGTNGQFVDIVDKILLTDDAWQAGVVCSVNSSPHTLVLVVQLCLSPISLHPDYCNSAVARFDWSQHEVYASPVRQPVFLGRYKHDLNVLWCLIVVNFFKFHLKATNGEGLLSHAFGALSRNHLPRPWIGRLQQETQELERHWKGSLCFLRPGSLASLRMTGRRGHRIYSDEVCGPEFQDAIFIFDEAKFGEGQWQAVWEKVLKSNPFSAEHRHVSGRSTRSRRSREDQGVESPAMKYFYGSLQSDLLAHFCGIVHAIPTQHGIPGFQRITMVKYFPDEPAEMWAYEGCVLPGGSVMVGRWWDATAEATDDVFSGPFIFWNVELSDDETPMDGQVALDFFNSMRYAGF
ncbi:Myo-inositol transporter 1 protein [Rutstroemia sp. NJR-2017a BBW]|nr:Myo-inositol transporter 1 protein [Rutstroemia sp. NJR-2017a BBW]